MLGHLWLRMRTAGPSQALLGRHHVTDLYEQMKSPQLTPQCVILSFGTTSVISVGMEGL